MVAFLRMVGAFSALPTLGQAPLCSSLRYKRDLGLIGFQLTPQRAFSANGINCMLARR
jgi:hypothetical protein